MPGRGGPSAARKRSPPCAARTGRPIYAFLRRHGHDADAATDLTNDRLRHLLEKHALDSVNPRSAGSAPSCSPRSSTSSPTSASTTSPGNAVAGGRASTTTHRSSSGATSRCGARSLDPEQAFERHWAAAVLARAVAQVRAEQEAAGRGREFAVLAGYLTSDGGGERPYRDVAVELGTTETAVRAAVHRLRQATRHRTARRGAVRR